MATVYVTGGSAVDTDVVDIN